MARLWARVISRNRIQRQTTVNCAFEDAKEAMTELCNALDIARPLWLNKHEKEFQEFRHTSFLPEHFMEDMQFDKLEIEFLDDEDRRRASRDPRNAF